MAGLAQYFQVAVQAFVFCKIQAGNLSGGVIYGSGKALALIVAKLIEPGIWCTVYLEKITLALSA